MKITEPIEIKCNGRHLNYISAEYIKDLTFEFKDSVTGTRYYFTLELACEMIVEKLDPKKS